ncbi:MAG: RidA family protein [Candidatus Anammoxibacter sp.]
MSETIIYPEISTLKKHAGWIKYVCVHTMSFQVWTAGAVPRDADYNIIEGHENQFKAVFDDLESCLNGAGTSIKNAIKIHIFLQDMAVYNDFNKWYKENVVKKYGDKVRRCVAVGINGQETVVEAEIVAALEEGKYYDMCVAAVKKRLGV